MDTHYPALAGVFPRKGSGVSAMIVVYVLAPDRTPLMPCTPVVARLLLKDGKARCYGVHHLPSSCLLNQKRATPITSLVLETGTFDPHALKSPEELRNKWLL